MRQGFFSTLEPPGSFAVRSYNLSWKDR